VQKNNISDNVVHHPQNPLELKQFVVCNAARRITAACREWTHFVKRMWRDGITIVTRGTSWSSFATTVSRLTPKSNPRSIILWDTKRSEREADYLTINTEGDSAWSVDLGWVCMQEHGFPFLLTSEFCWNYVW